MDKNKSHRLVIVFVTVACIGLTVESVLMKWEYWMLPVFVLGTAALWVLHITQRIEERYREMFYLLYGLFAAFFHGVHETSFFDVIVVMVLMLSVFSLLDHFYMLDVILAEFFFLMAIQVTLALRDGGTAFDPLNISRLALHSAVMVCVYMLCRVGIRERLKTAQMLDGKEREIRDYDKDMEDFLANISHELRTPINVVNGMSALRVKRGLDAEMKSVRDAGIRLACRVEDIQDFTEIKRAQIVVEEENYMITSLIHDVVASLRAYEDGRGLEFVVDMGTSIPNVMRGDVRKLRKLFRHLLDNAVKFTRHGGVYIRAYAVPKDYGVNLCLEVTDTGCGMTRADANAAAKGLYQADRRRDRSTGGIGLGLHVVYGLVHAMSGCVKIESEKGKGTTVRVTVPQKVIDAAPCLELNTAFRDDILFHVRSEKYRVPQVREFYRNMAVNLATGLGCRLYSAETVQDVEQLIKKLNVAYIFMGQEEYEAESAYFDRLSRNGITAVISARAGFRAGEGSRAIVMPKPLYGVPVTRILNGCGEADLTSEEDRGKVQFAGVRALVVDDEPMNLVVASGVLRDYNMIADTAGSGAEAIEKFHHADYDVIFMDHMMPEMDGVTAMKRLREAAAEKRKFPAIIALTANAVSGAREMFLREGFDGFIAKPIDISDFERVMRRVLPESAVSSELPAREVSDGSGVF